MGSLADSLRMDEARNIVVGRLIMRPSRSQLPNLYGAISNGIWIDQPKWMSVMTVPGWLWPYWKFQGKEVHSIYLHKEMMVPLYNAWNNIRRFGVESEIKSYDGCFAIRKSRSDERLSVHSYGLAIDINAEANPLGKPPRMHPDLVKSFELAGFVWGGRWANPDGMHMEFVTED